MEFFGRPAYTMTLVGASRRADGRAGAVVLRRGVSRGAAATASRSSRRSRRVLRNRRCARSIARSSSSSAAARSSTCGATTATRFPRACGRRADDTNARARAVLTRIAVGIAWLLHFLPLPIFARIGSGLGGFLYHLRARAPQGVSDQSRPLLSADAGAGASRHRQGALPRFRPHRPRALDSVVGVAGAESRAWCASSAWSGFSRSRDSPSSCSCRTSWGSTPAARGSPARSTWRASTRDRSTR